MMRTSVWRAALGVVMAAAVVWLIGGCGGGDPLKQGDIAMKVGQYGKAIELYKRVISAQPSNMEVRLKVAQCHEALHEYDNAEAAYGEIIGLDPQRKDLLANLASVSISKAVVAKEGGASLETIEQYWQEARNRLAAAAQGGARPAVVHHFWGLYHLRRGESALAIEENEKAIVADAEYAPAREALIELYMSAESRDINKAAEHAKTLLEKDASNRVAGLAQARVYRLQGQGELAVEQLKALLKTRDNDWEVHQDLALSYLLLGDMDNALEEAKRTHSIKKSAVMAHYVKGAAYLQKGDSALAATHFEEVAKVESVPELAADANAKLALCKLNEKLYESAKQYAEKAISLQNTQTEARFYLAQVYRQLKMYGEAQDQLEYVLDIDPSNVQAMDLLLRVAMDKGDLDLARQVQSRLKELGGGLSDIQSLTREAMLALLSGDVNAAALVGAKAVEEFPKDANARRVYGQALQAQKKYDLAIEQYRELRQLEPDSADGYVLIHNAYHEAGQMDKAVEELEAAIRRLPPESLLPYQELAALREEQGDLEKAAQLLEKYRSSHPGTPSSFELARIYLMQGKLDEAITLWREAQDKFPQEARFPANLAVAYQLQKQWADAEAAAQEAIRRSEDSKQQREAIAYALLKANVKLAEGEWDVAEETVKALDISADRKADYLALIAFARKTPEKAAEAANSLNLGQLYAHSRRIELAIAEYDKAQKLVGDACVTPLYLKADIYASANQPEQAVAAYQEIVQRKADASSAWSNLARLYLVKRDFEKASNAAQKAVEIAPDSIPSLLVLANCALVQGEFQSAIDHSEAVLALKPSTDEAYRSWEVKGQALLMLGQRVQAEEAFKQLIALKPTGSQALLLRARMLVSNGSFMEAASLANEAVKLDPCNADALVVRGIASFGLNRVDDAIRDFRTAIDCQPDYVASYLHFAKVLEGIHNLNGAQRIYERAIERNPDSYSAHFWLGELLKRQEKPDVALEQFKLVHEIVARRGLKASQIPENVQAMVEEARVYFQQGKTQQAMEASRQVVETRPDRPELRLLVAALYKLAGDYPSASAELKSLLDSNPDIVQAYELATFYFNQGDYAQSAQVLTAWDEHFKNRRVNPAVLAVFQTRLAIAQEFSGQPKDAAATTLKAIAQNAQNVSPQLARANLLMQQKDFDLAGEVINQVRTQTNEDELLKAAIVAYVQALAGKPNGPELAALGNKGLFYALSSWPEQAVEPFESLAKELPDSLFVMNQLGTALLQIKDSEAARKRAREVYEKCATIQPKFRTAYRTLASLANDDKDDQAMLKYYDMALAAYPGDIDFTVYKAAQLEKLGRFDEAIKLYQDVINQPQGVGNWVALNNLAWLLADKRNDLRTALDLVNRATVVVPNDSMGQVLDTRGWIQYLLGNYADAKTDLEQAVEKLPSMPLVRYHYGAVLDKVGRPQEAIFQLEMALEIDPKFEKAEEAAQLLKDIRSRPAPVD